jgi:hypothetical protein
MDIDLVRVEEQGWVSPESAYLLHFSQMPLEAGFSGLYFRVRVG